MVPRAGSVPDLATKKMVCGRRGPDLALAAPTVALAEEVEGDESCGYRKKYDDDWVESRALSPPFPA